MKEGHILSALFGLALILLGASYLVIQFIPGLAAWFRPSFWWPAIIIGFGGFFVLAGLLSGAHGLAIPGCIIAGIGTILFWQNATGNWASWAYVWTLIPGFVGLGVLLSSLFSGKVSEAIAGGGTLMVISLVLFAVFGGLFGGLRLIGVYWPVLLIVAGVLWLLGTLFAVLRR